MLTQLMDQHNKILDSFSQGKNFELSYLDYAKAFDLVDILLLLKKLKNIGFKSKLLKWLKVFLENRNQRVRIDNYLPDPRDIMICPTIVSS